MPKKGRIYEIKRNQMNYLIVVAHPDDEILGAGATIHKLVSNGDKVAVSILSEQASVRQNLSDTLSEDELNAMKTVGVHRVYHANFPNIKMNIVPHIELVKFIEECIVDWGAEAIITHHPSDTNNDHHETSKAVNAACRLFQRREGVPKLRLLAYMEVPSSTEWALNTGYNLFKPNLFIEVGKEGIEKKIEALKSYVGVMRPYPHPRSVESLMGLGAIRGSQAGVEYAEAFECVFRTD